ncbi:MAG: thiazole synthase, partial [Finegoldia magna]|nr:thiazole synthase [Finegoldia magna]MDU5977367.1 thiazole synthase [Finegoldia magna]
MEDKLILGGKSFDSRFILGSGKYDPNLIKACVESAGCEMITVALRRANTDDTKNI